MASYPDSIYEPRVKENKQGVEYDPAKTTIPYAEDVTKLDAEVVAIEAELGVDLGALLYQKIKAYIYTGQQMRVVAFDSNDNLYILGNIAYQGIINYLAVFKSTDLGLTWSMVGAPFGARTVVGNFSAATGVYTLRIASNGNIGVLYRGYNDVITGVYNLYFALWNGASWTVEAVSSESTSGRDITNRFDLAVDNLNDWYAVWGQKHAASTSYAQIRYCKRTAGSWGAIGNIGDTPINTSEDYPCVVIDSSGYPRIVCRKGLAGTPMYLYVWDGEAWVAYSSANSRYPYQISIDSSDNIYIATAGNLWKVTAAGAFSEITGYGDSIINQLILDNSGVPFVLGIAQNAGYASYAAGALIRKYNGAWSNGQLLAGSWAGECAAILLDRKLAVPKALFFNRYLQIFKVVNLTG